MQLLFIFDMFEMYVMCMRVCMCAGVNIRLYL